MELLGYGDESDHERDVREEEMMKNEEKEGIESENMRDIEKRWAVDSDTDSENERTNQNLEKKKLDEQIERNKGLISVSDLFVKDIPPPAYLQMNDIEGYKVELITR